MLCYTEMLYCKVYASHGSLAFLIARRAVTNDVYSRLTRSPRSELGAIAVIYLKRKDTQAIVSVLYSCDESFPSISGAHHQKHVAVCG